MNKSVLRTAIAIIVCMLFAEYILKFFVPEEFVLVVSNANLVKAGTFINNTPWLYYICNFMFSFITYYLFTCACGHTKYLRLELCILLVPIIIIAQIISKVAYTFATPYLICTMIISAYLNKADLKTFMIVFVVHTIAQNLSLEIRNISAYMVNYDIITCTMMTSECYLWLLLFYVLYGYNIKEKEVKK